MMIPRFSIISPSFNQAPFIARTLESVASQRGVTLEHLIFDPGSVDGALDVLRDYAATAPFARLFLETDRGQADAINKGLQRARGDIVAWLNTDDYYADVEVLRLVAAAFDADPSVGVVYGRGDFVDAAGKLVRPAFINTDAANLNRTFVHSVGILQPAAFFRRSLIDCFGLLDTDLACAFDYELWLRWANRGVKFHFIDRGLAKATFHSDAKSSALRSRQLSESIDATVRHYGFAPAQWVRRLVNCDLKAENGIVDSITVNVGPTAATIERSYEALFRRLNGAKSNLTALLQCPATSDYQPTRDAFAGTGLADLSRIIVTTFSDDYMDQGLTLIASIQRHADASLPIFVYDLNLSNANKARLHGLKNVFVVPYPHVARLAYDAFLSPKSYGYKCVALNDAQRFTQPGGLVLWMDAGVALAKPPTDIFSIIDRDDVFFIDHDDKPNWPFYNRTFTHPYALAQMKASRDEMIGEHLCSCLIGYRAGGRFRHLFQQAAAYALDERKVVWDKHPIWETADDFGVVACPPNPPLLRRWRRDREAFLRASPSDIELAFGYLGHRQDQSIFSILASRYGAPLQSARRYCLSNDRSSEASRLNWAKGEASHQFGAADDISEFRGDPVTIHHRGTYKAHENLKPARTETPDLLVVLGNGPSLKGFDFKKLIGLDAVGMNAAYRYWREIGWYPRYYICLDLVVGVSHKDEIEKLIREREQNGIEAFVLRTNLIGLLAPDVRSSKTIFDFDELRKASPLFSAMPITTGSHAALFGAMLGYRRIILMGVDCNYVEKVAGAESREGTQLILTATPSDNPNYFFPGYQMAGDKYNIPNPTPDLHINSWRSVAPVLAQRGVSVFNGSAISKVDCFAFATFDDVVEMARAAPPLQRVEIAPAADGGIGRVFDRNDDVSVDETQVVARLLSTARGDQHVMMDIGAHFGTSAQYFSDLGWTVHCFEPDESNRQKLVARFKDKPNVTIDARAVSDQSMPQVSFYRSDQSTGISGLHAFHNSHLPAGQVEVTTIREVVDRRNIDHLDFLKIDVEGFDYSVLKGVPWDQLKPRVIECEFEDAKTERLGFTYREMADYLIERGYAVYVSEWHPIIRYGVAHQWRRLKRYPCHLDDPKAWGNLLAFQDDPGSASLDAAFEDCLMRKLSSAKVDSPEPILVQTASEQINPPGRSAALMLFAQWLNKKSPRGYAFAHRGYRNLAPLLRPVFICGVVGAILLSAMFGVATGSIVIFVLSGAILSAGVLVVSVLLQLVRRLSQQVVLLRRRLAGVEAKLGMIEQQSGRVEVRNTVRETQKEGMEKILSR